MSMMINCQEAGRLLSEKMDRRLIWRERAKLLFHLSMCKVCTNVKRQFELIRQAARRLGQDPNLHQGGTTLPQNVKARLVRTLKEKSF